MVEEEHIRNNRLAILAAIAKDIDSFADFGKLVW
jgi:glycyl-tRNA synthetase beta chain